MTDIYLLIIEDRHLDVEVRPYSTENLAMAAFNKCAEDWGAGPPLLPEAGLDSGMVEKGWLIYAEYSIEGDSIRVVKCELDKAE